MTDRPTAKNVDILSPPPMSTVGRSVKVPISIHQDFFPRSVDDVVGWGMKLRESTFLNTLSRFSKVPAPDEATEHSNWKISLSGGQMPPPPGRGCFPVVPGGTFENRLSVLRNVDSHSFIPHPLHHSTPLFLKGGGTNVPPPPFPRSVGRSEFRPEYKVTATFGRNKLENRTKNPYRIGDVITEGISYYQHS